MTTTIKKSSQDKLVEEMSSRSSDDVMVTEEIRFQGEVSRLETLISQSSSLIYENYPEIWAIYLRGKRIKFHNGKAVWKTKGHARTALSDKVKQEFTLPDRKYIPGRDELYKQVLAYMEANKIIEFRELSQSDQV